MQAKNYGENLWLGVKTKTNLKPKLTTKAFWNTYDKELGGAMKCVNEKYFKSSFENFQKSLPFREICVKHLEKNGIVIVVQL